MGLKSRWADPAAATGDTHEAWNSLTPAQSTWLWPGRPHSHWRSFAVEKNPGPLCECALDQPRIGLGGRKKGRHFNREIRQICKNGNDFATNFLPSVARRGMVNPQRGALGSPSSSPLLASALAFDAIFCTQFRSGSDVGCAAGAWLAWAWTPACSW